MKNSAVSLGFEGLSLTFDPHTGPSLLSPCLVAITSTATSGYTGCRVAGGAAAVSENTYTQKHKNTPHHSGTTGGVFFSCPLTSNYECRRCRITARHSSLAASAKFSPCSPETKLSFSCRRCSFLSATCDEQLRLTLSTFRPAEINKSPS